MPILQHSLRIDVAHVSNACVIRVGGELDTAGCPALELALDEAEQSRADRLTIDLEELTFIDSTGLHVLLKASQRAASKGDHLQITRGKEHIERVFRLTELDQVLPLTDACLCPEIRDAGPGTVRHEEAAARGIVVDCGSLTAAITRRADGYLIELEGRLDLYSAMKLEWRLPFPSSTDIALDLSRVDFIDSTGLWLVVMIMRGAETKGAGVQLVGSSSVVEQAFERAGLTQEPPFMESTLLEPRIPVERAPRALNVLAPSVS
jgi:anti-sigma B factor antagonist